MTGLVKLETVITTHGELQQMVQLAEGLCDLVRVKIEDDNDLGLALSGKYVRTRTGTTRNVDTTRRPNTVTATKKRTLFELLFFAVL